MLFLHGIWKNTICFIKKRNSGILILSCPGTIAFEAAELLPAILLLADCFKCNVFPAFLVNVQTNLLQNFQTMKHTRTLTRLLLIWTLLTACNKSNLNFHDEYEKSYNSWLSFKQQHGNSYTYQVTQGSWTGVGSQTIITVKDGKVTQLAEDAQNKDPV